MNNKTKCDYGDKKYTFSDWLRIIPMSVYLKNLGKRHLLISHFDSVYKKHWNGKLDSYVNTFVNHKKNKQ